MEINVAFNPNTNTNEGGDSGTELLDHPLFNHTAINFGFQLFIPPPLKLRGTSFQEPYGADGYYIREDATAEEELKTIIIGRASLMHIQARGTTSR